MTQVQTHSALETHGLVAKWDGDDLTVWASTQGVFDMRDELAKSLNVPVSKVRVITEYMGGGFGAKFGPRVEGVTAARLAKAAGAPVKLFLDRKEEQLASGNRPSAVQTVKAGATKDGKLTALQLTVYGNGGTNGGTGTSGPIKNVYCLRQPQGRRVRRLHQRRPLDRDARSRSSAGRLRPRGDDGRARARRSAWIRSSSG